MIKQAMIFAAGLGTRLKPLTDTMPKALVPVAGQPLIWHVIQRLKAAGFGQIVVNVHHFGQQIIDYLDASDRFSIDISISDERDSLLETGGGIRKARHLFHADSPVLIHNVDILSNLNLNALWDAATTSQATTLAISERESASGRYLLFDADRRLVGWTNSRTGEVRSPFADALARATLRAPFAGIHVISPELMPLMDSWPDRFSIIDFYLNVCRDYVIKGHLEHFCLIDVGKLDSLSAAESLVKSQLTAPEGKPEGQI